MTLLMATEAPAASAAGRPGSASRARSGACRCRCILLRRAYLARWTRRSRAVMCSMARLACLIIVIFLSPKPILRPSKSFVKIRM